MRERERELGNEFAERMISMLLNRKLEIPYAKPRKWGSFFIHE
jgi:hypothetical protein